MFDCSVVLDKQMSILLNKQRPILEPPAGFHSKSQHKVSIYSMSNF